MAEEEMNEDDKNFMRGLFESLKEQITKLEKHQAKTCTELDTVDNNVNQIDKNVIQLSSDLKNHLDAVRKEELDKIHVSKSKREKHTLIISGISVSAAIISTVVALFVTSF